jgi:hypothetical protein
VSNEQSHRISSHNVDETIQRALTAISHALQASPEESLAAQADGLAASETLLNWIIEAVETSDGVVLTRDEFRRRLESNRARHAGHAERFRLKDSCERLEQLVLRRGILEPEAERAFRQ